MNKSFNPAISVIRVISMIIIIVGHWCRMVGIEDYQLTSIGVEIFLIISGYLYGKKAISNKKVWLTGRLKRVIFPYWVVLLVAITVRIIFDFGVNPLSVVLYALNLQGINRVFLNLKYTAVFGVGQTWFLTVLMLSYFIMLLIKQKKIEHIITKHKWISLSTAILIQCVLLLIGVQIVYILCFFTGYFIEKLPSFKNKKQFALLTLSLLLVAAVRIISRKYIDGTMIYDQVIARWSFILLAIWIIAMINGICQIFIRAVNKITSTKQWRFIDFASYPLYLTHFIFMSGELATVNFVNNVFAASILSVLLTAIYTIILILLVQRKEALSILR